MIEYGRKALQGVPDYRAAELLPSAVNTAC